MVANAGMVILEPFLESEFWITVTRGLHVCLSDLRW
jgi:hypothetical protein